MSTTTTTHRPSPKPPLDLELTIISAKHLKNVNWRNGDLHPYAIFYLDPDRRQATKSDDSNNTKPVWNERFLIPVPPFPSAAVLTLEIFHSKPSDTPKPLVGTLRIPIDDLPNPDDFSIVRSFDLRRPSGRIQGKIRLKLAVRQRPVPDYQIAPQSSFYYNTATPSSYGRYPPYPPSPALYNTAPPPPVAAPPAPSPPPPPAPARPYHYDLYNTPPPPPSPAAAANPVTLPPPPPAPARPYNYDLYSDPYSGYYHGGYYSHHQQQPSHTPRPYNERPSGYSGGGDAAAGGGGPSAPVEYGQYEQKQKSGKIGSGPTGLGLGLEAGVGAVAGGIAGMGIDEGMRYHQDEKIGERVESDLNARELDDYSGYRRVDY